MMINIIYIASNAADYLYGDKMPGLTFDGNIEFAGHGLGCDYLIIVFEL